MKKEEQDKLIAWSNKMCEPSYPDALMAIEQIVSDRKDLRFRSWMLDEAILRGIEFTSVPTQMDMVIEALKGKDKKSQTGTTPAVGTGLSWICQQQLLGRRR